MRPVELADCIRRMPKAELHLHFEGALRWSTVREFNPQARSLETPPWLGKPFSGFEEFRDIFHNFLMPASGTEDRIERLMFEMLEDLARQNVRYAEPIVYLPFHSAQGLNVRQVLGAMQRGMLGAERRHRIASRLILGLNRGREAGQEVALAREALEVRDQNGARLVAGLDVMSDDRFGIQPEFVELYREARHFGLRLKVHAGEMGGPDIVRDALAKLEPDHLSHGIRAAEDEKLLRQLATSGIWFHVCPTSNVLLGAARSYSSHPIKRLLDAGCSVTLNSDDPILFGTDITNEYLRAAVDIGCTAQQIERLAMNGFAASLLAEPQRAQFAQEIRSLFRDGAS